MALRPLSGSHPVCRGGMTVRQVGGVFCERVVGETCAPLQVLGAASSADRTGSLPLALARGRRLWAFHFAHARIGARADNEGEDNLSASLSALVVLLCFCQRPHGVTGNGNESQSIFDSLVRGGVLCHHGPLITLAAPFSAVKEQLILSAGPTKSNPNRAFCPAQWFCVGSRQ